MKIDLTYDLVCPWCYLSATSLEVAVSRQPDIDLQLWPYQLTPDVPVAGVDHDAFFAARVGKAQAKQCYRQMEKLAEQAGIPLRYASIRRLPNTRLAHRAVLFAQSEGQGLAVLNALMQAHFTGIDIGSVDAIVKVFEEHGGNAERLRRHLADSVTEDDFPRFLQRAISRGVRGVPHVEIDGVASAGARSVEEWQTLLAKASV